MMTTIAVADINTNLPITGAARAAPVFVGREDVHRATICGTHAPACGRGARVARPPVPIIPPPCRGQAKPGGEQMPKTVAVMNGLEQVARALREQGIQVVDVADVGAPISAIVYSAQVDPSGSPSTERSGGLTGGGVDDLVLMLNADYLSVDEIVARVKAVW